MLFAVTIHRDTDSDFGVTVPDLPGCFSAGSTLIEALHNAKEAIECHLEGMLMDDEDIPAPAHSLTQSAETADLSSTYHLAVIEVDMDQLSMEKERVNISLPRIALKAIDRAASRAGKTRSAYIVEASLNASRAG